MTDLTDVTRSVSASETVLNTGVACIVAEIGVKMLDTVVTERSDRGLPR